MKKRHHFIAMVSALLTVTAMPVSAAHAAEQTPSSGSAVREVVDLVTGSELASGQSARSTANERASARKAYAQSQMRQGRLVDFSATRSSVVDGATTVWEDGVAINSVRLATAKSGTDGDVAESIAVDAYSDGSAETSGAATSLGLSGALRMTGATFQSGYCTTTSSSKGNNLTSCFQKYRLSTKTATRDFFYYNRYATAVGKAVSWDYDWQPTKIDVRSRPWAGYSSQVAALVDYWPKAGIKNCTDHSVTVGYGSFSAQMPIQDCNEVNPSPNATAKSMTVIYDQGAIFDGRVHGTDMSLVYSTFKGKNPAYADYSYAKFCKGNYLTCDGVLRKDSGW